MTEVILYAAIATIICAMLYSVLGKSVGRGPEAAFDPKKFLDGDSNEQAAVIEPVEEYGDFPEIGKIRAFDPHFSLTTFLDQSQGAYSVILEAFAEGDKTLLKELLTPKVYDVYEAAITDREVKNLTQITDLARLVNAEVTAVECNKQTARISVNFKAELASALTDAEGEVVQGDPNVLSTSQEVWSFERDLKNKNPNWLLADVAPSDSDHKGADPTPDTVQ